MEILSKWDDLEGIHYQLNNICCSDETVLIVDSDGKFKELLNMVIEGSKKGIMINCKKTECTVLSKKKKRQVKCELDIGNIENKCKNSATSVITDKRNCVNLKVKNSKTCFPETR